jgi:phage gp36-like protein|tara:strand:- start:531 stop:932 length:402 start_codon:yes stop_codon:yes gene_type:complete
MSSYIEQTDIENVFGTDNVATWSNLAGGTTVDTDRIDSAILYAEALVEDSFRGGKYDLPFSPIPEVVKDWCSKLAGIWLFMCRPGYRRDSETTEGFADIREIVLSEIATYNSGQRLFDCNASTSKGISGPVVI